MYKRQEDINGNPREGGTATWEEIAEELSDAGILKEIKTARQMCIRDRYNTIQNPFMGIRRRSVRRKRRYL